MFFGRSDALRAHHFPDTIRCRLPLGDTVFVKRQHAETGRRARPTRTWQETLYLAAHRLFERVSRSAQQREIMALLKKIDAQQHDQAKWRAIFRRQLNAVIRRQLLADSDILAPNSLNAHRFRLRSQNEEDGITLTLLRTAGVANRRFVEIGCGTTGGNSAILAFEFGWSGLMVDAEGRKVAALQQALAFNPGVTVVRSMVTPENLNDLLAQYGYSGELDFMSVDVDSVDYWLLDALHVCSPRVLVMEYNALFGPHRAVTLPMAGLPAARPKGYFGASLAALEKKARQKGYRLVLCEDAGVNAFFLRDDVAPHVSGVTPAVAYRSWRERLDLIDSVEKPIDIFALIDKDGLPLVEV